MDRRVIIGFNFREFIGTLIIFAMLLIWISWYYSILATIVIWNIGKVCRKG